MIELATGFATLSLFLAWRLYEAKRQLNAAKTFVEAVIDGKLVFTPTEDGMEVELRGNLND